MADASDGGGRGNDGAILADLGTLLGIGDHRKGGKTSYKIGDLAREFGVTLRSLRFYEDRGLLKPERRGTTRLYSRADRERLRIVLLGKTLGFTLLECQELVKLHAGPDNGRLLKAMLKLFEEQRTLLLEQRRDVGTSLEALNTATDVLKRRLAALVG